MRVIEDKNVLTEDLVSQYLEGAGRYELLSAEEEVELAQAMEEGEKARRHLAEGKFSGRSEQSELERIHQRGKASRRRFIEANLRLVVSNARRYVGGSVEMLDLIQEGNLGLMTAVEKFDWRRGFKFSTYATWWIRQAMQRARANLGDTIRIPAGVFDILPAVRSASEQLEAKLGRAATVGEIADETGISESDVDRALSVTTTVALETPVGEDGAQLADFIADSDAADPETEAERLLLDEALRRSVAQLSDKARIVIEMRFGLGQEPPATLGRISEVVDMPEHQIRALIKETLDTLYDSLIGVEEMRVA